MEAAAEIFNHHRPRLFGIAYRMLGARADAEDVVQDAYLRWHTQGYGSELQSPQAWLVTVVTRLAIDRLRDLKAHRADYPGPWLPEPLAEAESPSPESAAELAGDVSVALMVALERLAPEERAALLLREVFDFDYAEVASALNRNEAAIRQLVHRAKERVKAVRQRFAVKPEAHRRLLERFAAAVHTGNREHLLALFTDGATLTSDGGGKVVSVLRVLSGPDRIARLYMAVARRMQGHFTHAFAVINGELGLLRYVDGEIDSVMSFVTDGTHIVDIYIQRNPDKLAAFRS